MGLMKELNDLNDIYQNMYAEDENKGYVVTRADKKGNTPAWQGYKAGKKKKDGKPMYRAADHLKNEGYEEKKKEEVLGAMKKQGRKLSDKEKNKIANKVVKDKGDTSKSDDRYAYEEVQVEGALVKAAGAVEKVGGAVKKGVKAFNKADEKVTKATLKVGGKVARAAGRAFVGGVKGAVKGALNKEELEFANKLIESGLFSAKEIANIADIQEADIADILAQLEKKRIRQGGDPDKSPLGKKTGRAMKAQQDKARKKAGM